jgi:hypothetical protein
LFRWKDQAIFNKDIILFSEAFFFKNLNYTENPFSVFVIKIRQIILILLAHNLKLFLVFFVLKSVWVIGGPLRILRYNLRWPLNNLIWLKLDNVSLLIFVFCRFFNLIIALPFSTAIYWSIIVAREFRLFSDDIDSSDAKERKAEKKNKLHVSVYISFI